MFLLQTYCLMFFFVVLTSTMLARSSTDLQAAKMAIETHHAFWQAEAGTDELIHALKLNPPALYAGQCTAPILRLMAGASTAGAYLGPTSPFTDGVWDASSALGYEVQVCLAPAGEYQVVSVALMGNSPAATVVTTLTNVPNHNLQFNRAFLATGSITAQQSTFASVSATAESMPYSYDSTTNTFNPDPTVVHSNANLATLAIGSPTPPACTTTSGDPTGAR